MKQVKALPGYRAKSRSRAQSPPIQVIARAAQILRILGDSKGLSLAGISESVGLPRSTVHRIVIALQSERFISSNGPGQYRVGPEILHLAESCKLDLIRDIHPFLVRLSHELDETVDLSVRSGRLVTVIDQIIAMHRLRVDAALGKSFPLHCTASGKAILAGLPDEIGQALLSTQLEGLTSKTITNRADLQAEIEQVRKTGIAFDREELSIGLCAIGSCLNIGDEVIAISIPVPAGRFYGREAHISRSLARFISLVSSAFPSVKRAFTGPPLV